MSSLLTLECKQTVFSGILLGSCLSWKLHVGALYLKAKNFEIFLILKLQVAHWRQKMVSFLLIFSFSFLTDGSVGEHQLFKEYVLG